MSFRVPVWYRWLGLPYQDKNVCPPHTVEGSRLIVPNDEKSDTWYDDWKYLFFKFVELKSYLVESNFNYTPGCRIFFFQDEKHRSIGPDFGLWNMETFVDFQIDGEGILFAMWMKEHVSAFEDRRNSPFHRQTLPQSDESFEGVIFKEIAVL